MIYIEWHGAVRYIESKLPRGGNMKHSILLVEDEQKIAEGIMDYMNGGEAEYETSFTWADDGDKALELVYENEYWTSCFRGQMDLRYAGPSGQRVMCLSFF